MAKSLDERRSGRDRRRSRDRATAEAERRKADRRQFPPPEDPARITEEERLLQHAVDAYKMEQGLARISMAEFLGVLANLGYRRI
ncbi:MAG: hypothetical protein WBD63_10560 [Phycisphaerae bacterium]|nr:hypothetical protein [Phycisphaerae bacterium]